MVLGPLVQAGACWAGLADDARRSPRGALRLLTHLGGVAVVLLVVDAAGIALWVYVVGVAWVGGALSLLRSFAEHRWTASGTRSAVVNAGPAMSLLYLNNNLHHTHHQRPGVAWFRLPVEHRRLDASTEAARGAGAYAGYGDVVRRYLFRAFDAPVVTSTASPSPVGASVASTPQPATAR
jgi:fatty acid desaturase